MPRAPSIRTRFRSLSILILLGLMLNLIVSWSLLLIPRYSAAADLRVVQFRNPNTEYPHDAIFSVIHQWFGVHEHQFYLTRRSRSRDLPKRTSLYWTWLPWDSDPDAITRGNELFTSFAPEHPDHAIISTTRVGFPSLAMETQSLVDDFSLLSNGSLRTESHYGFISRVDGVAGTTKPGIWPHAPHILFPYKPIWIGFAINTVFYTTLVFTLIWTVRQIKHARRMRRGRCPYCDYERHHDFRDGCPECGWRRVHAHAEQ